MDETEKYKQRLEAIAEKRRLQEEQDKAKREMEDEKLRLQQLKRKSLRDQWLMEGAPLSPTSPDAQSPRSPLWGSQAQEMEKRTEKLESESQRLAEEEEKLKEQMEDSQIEPESAAESAAEIIQDAVVQNGENNATELETTEDEVKTDQGPQLEEAAPVLSNGQVDCEAESNHTDSEKNNWPTSNGPVEASEDLNAKQDPGFGPGDVLNVSIEEKEEEEGTVVIRAERVIITDEGDDVAEIITPMEDQQETIESEETPLEPNTDADKDGGEAEVAEVAPEEVAEAVEEVAEAEEEVAEAAEEVAEAEEEVAEAEEEVAEAAEEVAEAEEEVAEAEEEVAEAVEEVAEAVEEVAETEAKVASVTVEEEEEEAVIRAATQPDQSESAEEREKQPDLSAGETDTKAEGHDRESEEPTSEQVQCPVDPLEGTTVASVPVYSEVPLPTLAPVSEAEGDADESTGGAETALQDQDPASVPSQFQDVPLADPQDSSRTEAGPEEQEPLLSQAKVPDTLAATSTATDISPASTETQIPSRDEDGEGTQTPKRKSCQCCSVM